ncbi:MAG: hypothetical protein NT154_14210 [Verrucomicrobia bacterium]|nr:hypothetical protein [Verrucomicrobiota bacterium]
MPEYWTCRLLVVGPVNKVRAFVHSSWDKSLGAKHCEILECSPCRHSWQFELERSPLDALGHISSRFPGLVLFLEYEAEKARVKGLARVRNGRVDRCEFSY